MERKFSLTLSGGAQTTVSFVKGLEELTDALSSYQDNVFYVFDENSARLLSSIPEKSIVLPSGEVNKNIGSLEKIIGKALPAVLQENRLLPVPGNFMKAEILKHRRGAPLGVQEEMVIPPLILDLDQVMDQSV